MLCSVVYFPRWKNGKTLLVNGHLRAICQLAKSIWSSSLNQFILCQWLSGWVGWWVDSCIEGIAVVSPRKSDFVRGNSYWSLKIQTNATSVTLAFTKNTGWFWHFSQHGGGGLPNSQKPLVILKIALKSPQKLTNVFTTSPLFFYLRILW